MKPEQVHFEQHDKPGYHDGMAHIAAELARLDRILQIRVEELRQQAREQEHYAAALPTYVSHDEVDWLLSTQGDDISANTDTLSEAYQALSDCEAHIESAIQISLEQEVSLPLVNLARLFNLTWLEYQLIVVCLAPELRRRYDRIYAYLQDDITRKKPSLDLVLQLFCRSEQERWQARNLLNPESNLIKFNLIRIEKDAHSPSGSSGLASFVSLAPRILQYLLGANMIAASIQPYVDILSAKDVSHLECLHPAAFAQIQQTISQHEQQHSRAQLVYLAGSQGMGRCTLVLQALQTYAQALLVVDLAVIKQAHLDFVSTIRNILRESILLQTPIYFKNIAALQHVEQPDLGLGLLDKLLAEHAWVYFADGANAGQVSQAFIHLEVDVITVKAPTIVQRKQLWQNYVAAYDIQLADPQKLTSLAEKFILSPDQIHRIIRAVTKNNSVDYAQLVKACQAQSNQRLMNLATRIPPGYHWDDLILPDETKQVLQTVCHQVNHKFNVFSQWGFDEKVRYGRGLSVLFCGSPGTGKTMAAQVIANQLSLDLYKIDLSSVVSKYIGETEKNLDQVFTEAETSNAVLFFDECDALFGKRTEVSDAHDRYANLEVSFLLQKMEEYDGIVILATNLRGNMDDAFIRRIRFIIEFPFPDAVSREQIWRRSFPQKAPQDSNIPFDTLAHKIKLAGGNIKNIVLNAAFHASQQDDAIGLRHILQSAKSEYQKIGKSWNDNLIANPEDTVQ